MDKNIILEDNKPKRKEKKRKEPTIRISLKTLQLNNKKITSYPFISQMEVPYGSAEAEREAQRWRGRGFCGTRYLGFFF